MKRVRDITGRFPFRPHYEANELDSACERIICDFMLRKHGVISFPVSTDDLTALIESEAEDLDLYADLTKYGANVEGVTIFVPGAKPKVAIDRTLSENPSRENRLRTTLTHEFGHVHFHSHLFDRPEATLDLFAPVLSPGARTEPTQSLQMCRRETMINAAATNWMEWQAGYVCGAILMPSSQVQDFLRREWAQAVSSGPIEATCGESNAVVEAIREKFKVSREAARIRLLRLQVLATAGLTSASLEI